MKYRRVKILQFIALVLTALALVPGGAHVASLPNKIDLAADNYFVIQMAYNGWALFGVVLIGAVIANLAFAVAIRAQPLAFWLVAFTLSCLLASLAIFFVFTYPANVATGNWTAIPENWQALRWQWEISHAVNAALTLSGFCALALSVLAARP